MDKYSKYTEIAKKNWLSLTFGALAIAAVVAVPTFISSQQKALQQELVARKATYDKLTRLVQKPRHQPVVSLDPDVSPPDLSQFPNAAVIAAGEQAIKGVADQSLQLKQLALRMNQRRLLVDRSLPTPADPYRFRQVYLEQIRTVFPQVLNSVTPPTETEIQAEATRRTDQMTREAPQDQATGQIYNKEALDQNIRQMQAALPDQMRLNAATRHKMYMAPGAVSVHPSMEAGSGITRAPSPEDIWMAQMGLWIEQDVVTAIDQLNKASTQVSQSPVKQLVALYVPPDKTSLYVVPGITPGAAPPQPAGPNGAIASSVPTNSETDPLPKDFTLSPTGRVCNGIFDVTQFVVVLNVNASDVERVVQALEQDRLLTVYQTEVQAVNSAALQQEGFYFGKSPVVTLTMRCEKLFLRDWTRPYMPASIKQYLNVQEPAQVPGQPTASAN